MADHANGSNRGIQILVVGVLTLLFCGGIIAATAYLTVKDQREMPGMRAAGEAYLSALVRGDTGASYDLLCKRDRREATRATWNPYQDRSNPPTGFRITDVEIDRPEGAGAYGYRTVTAEVTRARYTSSEATLTVEKQDGVWKVCRPPAL